MRSYRSEIEYLSFPADQVFRVNGERMSPPVWPPPPDKIERLRVYPSPRVAFGVRKGSDTILIAFDYSQIETRIIAHLRWVSGLVVTWDRTWSHAPRLSSPFLTPVPSFSLSAPSPLYLTRPTPFPVSSRSILPLPLPSLSSFSSTTAVIKP